MWLHRNELSYDERRLRALYDSLREDLTRYLVEFSLVDSYNNFLKVDEPYPFVEKRELKPRAKVVERENGLINSFIVVFAEGTAPQEMKKYLRHFDNNKVTKENLAELKLTGLNVADRFQKQQKYFETSQFYVLLRSLLKVDYALLIQRDAAVKTKNRYLLSHYHVRIDWLLDAAAEALGKELRYVSKELYEKGLEIVTVSVQRTHPAALNPRIKSLNYLNNILAKIEGLQAGCIEALMLNHKGEVAECTGDNIFLVRGGVLYTPPLDAGILGGITRAAVIELARAADIEVREVALTKHDVYIADECFLTGTAAEVIPVVKVDSRSIGTGTPGPMTRDLEKAFRKLTQE